MTTMTTNDTMTADEAQRLLDGREAKGRWRSGSVEREGRVWAHDPDALGGHGVGEVCIFNANARAPHNGNRALCAAAPKLAASVVALHAQLAQVTAERTRDELNNARNVLADELTRVTRECDALRARAELAEAERADALSELTRVTAAHARDDAADAYDRLVARVWEAATGDTHEGPASVEVLLDAVRRLRARAGVQS